jgi:hypothetical protein
MSELESKLLPGASNEALIRYYALSSEEVDVLAKSNPEACVEMLRPTGKPIDPSQLLPNELL